jgi:hypothetical protein
MKRNYLKITAALIAALSLTFSACNDDDDDDEKKEDTKATLSGAISSDKNLDASKTYTLDGFVTVEDGATLTIPAGTLIEAKPGQGENASALIIKRGGTIMAEGTASKPVIFTAEGAGKEGGNLTTADQGLWGGLIILGKATTNNTTDQQVEGVPAEYSATYGGTEDADNSGKLNYVSIRHGGTDIGAGNEINGLTLAAVGSGTEIDYVEVVANKDDGIEWFGGAAQVKHTLIAFVGDDSYDYDEGFHGKGQFMVALQTSGTGDRCAEQDGGPSSNETGTPYAKPTFYNATYIGNGGKLMIFRDNAGGTYANSIFKNTATGIRIEYRDDKTSTAYKMLKDGNITIKNNVFSDVADGNDSSSIFIKVEKDDNDDPIGTLPTDSEQLTVDHFNNNNNAVESVSIDITNPVPASAPSATKASNPGGFFSAADYMGAFQPGGSNWASGWTFTFMQ